MHYLPHILQSGSLYAKSGLAERGIKPRSTAVRRDKMLGLADWVHLSTRLNTPLLQDKLARGFPHALLEFNRAAVLTLPEVALLPYNTKAWRSRSAYVPVTDPRDKAALLRCHDDTHRYPSLEVLVHYGLDLTHLQRVVFAADDECRWVGELMAVLGRGTQAVLEADASAFPPYHWTDETRLATRDYLMVCRAVKQLLPPPEIVFD